MRQCIETCCRVEPFGHRREQARVDDRDVRDQRPTQDGDLRAAVRVGDDAELRHVGAGARRRRNAHQGRNGHGGLVDTRIVEDVAAVGGEDGDSLGRIDHRTAAKCDQHIAPVGPVELVAGPDLVVLGIRGDRAPHLRVDALGAQVADEFVDPAGLYQSGIGDQQRTQRAEADRGVRGFSHRIDSEHDLRGVELQQARRHGRRHRNRRNSRRPRQHVQPRHQPRPRNV